MNGKYMLNGLKWWVVSQPKLKILHPENMVVEEECVKEVFKPDAIDYVKKFAAMSDGMFFPVPKENAEVTFGIDTRIISKVKYCPVNAHCAEPYNLVQFAGDKEANHSEQIPEEVLLTVFDANFLKLVKILLLLVKEENALCMYLQGIAVLVEEPLLMMKLVNQWPSNFSRWIKEHVCFLPLHQHCGQLGCMP